MKILNRSSSFIWVTGLRREINSMLLKICHFLENLENGKH